MKKIKVFFHTWFMTCVLSVSMTVISCSSDEPQQQNVVNTKTTFGTRSISMEIQNEINAFEKSYIEQFSVNNPNQVGVFGYKTMILAEKNKDVVKWVFKHHKKEIEAQKGTFIASDFSFYRIYFPLHTAIVNLSGQEYSANEKGIVQLPVQLSRVSISDLSVTGRIKSNKVTGCASNIITDNKIILKDELLPAQLRENTFIFDMGLIDCCKSGQMRSTPCTQNHGSYANCSDAFGIWGDNCVTRRDVCMDFNGWGSDCVKGPKTYFLGSDCQKAMLQGHCWNEIM